MRSFVAIRLGNGESFEAVPIAEGAVLYIRERGNREALSITMNEFQVEDLKRVMAKVPGKARSFYREAKKKAVRK